MGAQKQRFTDAQEEVRLFIANRRRWTIEQMYNKLCETFPRHNIRLLENEEDVHRHKITFDGRELYRDYFGS